MTGKGWVLTAAHLLMLGLACPQEVTPRRLETLLLLPEPKAMGTPRSHVPPGAEKTVFSPARELPDLPGIRTYGPDEFKRLGLSAETFVQRAKPAADRLLASFKPELVRDGDGKPLYALFRSDRPLVASLVMAPGLPALFTGTFGPEIWVVVPTRFSLFVFPAKPEVLQNFTGELAERYRNDAYAASPEIFALKTGVEPRVVGTFAE